MTYRGWIRPWARDAAALGLLALVWGLCYWRFLAWGVAAGDRVTLPPGDFWHQFYFYRAFAFDTLRSGHLPLWMPCTFSGYPYQADPQSALLYPSTVLNTGLWLVLNVAQFPREALQFESLLHVLLGAWLMYAFLRGEVRRRAAALLGALVWGFGGYLTGYPPLQMAMLQSIVWLPLVLLLIRRLVPPPGVPARGILRNVAWLGLALAVSFLAGHPQTAMLILYASTAYALFRLILRARHGDRGWRRLAAPLPAALVLGVALAAVQLVPALEFTGLSTRAGLTFETAGTGFPLQDIVQILLPHFVSLWQPLYAGVLPLALAAYALLAWRRGERPDAWFWLALALAGLLLSFGQHLFGFDLGYLFAPGYRLFRSQERHAAWVAFGLAVIAAYGADRLFGPLSRRTRDTARVVATALGGTAVLLFVLLAAATYLKRLGYDPSDGGDLPAAVGLVFLVATLATMLWAARLRGAGARTVAALMLLLCAFDLLSAGRDINAAPPGPIYEPNPAVDAIMADRPSRGGGPARTQEDGVLPGHILCMHGIDETRGASPIAPAAYVSFLERAPEALRLKLLGVDYVVSWRGALRTREEVLVPAQQIYVAGEGPDYRAVYRLAEPSRWAWLVHDVRPVGDGEALYAALASPEFDPFQSAVVEDVQVPAATPGGTDVVTLREYWPGHLAFDLAAGAGGLLVISEAAYPGWTAAVDGSPAQVVTADGVVLSVPVPAGARRVVLDYRPGTLIAGAAISGLALLVCIALLVAGGGRPTPDPAP